MKNARIFCSLVAVLFCLIGGFANAGEGGGTSANGTKLDSPSTVYRVIPFESYFQSSSLPPVLWADFKVRCNQRILQVFRHDVVRGNPRVTIVIGALVSEETLDPCTGEERKIVQAGQTYSGRDFDVKSLQTP